MKETLVKIPNKFEIIYGEVSGGLTSFSLPTSCRKKQYVNYVGCKLIGSRIYRFGKVDKCELPIKEGDLSIFEDTYCILNFLELKSLEFEKIIKEILQNNTKNKDDVDDDDDVYFYFEDEEEAWFDEDMFFNEVNSAKRYNGYGKYNEYGEHDRGYYYRDRRYESPIISSNHLGKD
ncbi:hypothetical protein RhiirA4_482627 [Rhizophagus irregularis]|uniref:Uncharacterized protein n=1 Tax=Rhizophagus irregularis TaxID=588596 RepID=A0A2I1HLD3_9GLOM|nr:hypothetical protein RhiirA4_482627 [Rhizophagus irregularis]